MSAQPEVTSYLSDWRDDPLALALYANEKRRQKGRKPNASVDLYYSPVNTKRGVLHPDGWRTVYPVKLDQDEGLLWVLTDPRDSYPRCYRVSGISASRRKERV